MSWTIVALNDVPATPWRNGGGVTHELIALPSKENWHWRVSVAEVASAGPFSIFEGVQRWLAILRGNGLELRSEQHSEALRVESPPLSFRGETPMQCTLIDGAVRDFNLMLRDQHATGALRRICGAQSFEIERSCIVGVFANQHDAKIQLLGERLTVPSEQFAWRSYSLEGSPEGLTRIQVIASDALWIEVFLN